MNRYFIFAILVLLFLNSCVCDSGCVSYQLESFPIIHQQWNYRTSERINIPFQSVCHKYEPKRKAFCIGYTKEYCIGSVSDEINADSTIVFCNKTLRQGSAVYQSNSNLLTYKDLEQDMWLPESIYTKDGGAYRLNLSNLDFNSADLTSPYIFTLRIKTNQGAYIDTAILTLQP